MEKEADICIVAEGSYPYYAGGVAQWVHELIMAHKEFTFHVITLVPPHPNLKKCYEFPANVIGHDVYIVQELPEGARVSEIPDEIWKILSFALEGLMTSPKFDHFEPLLEAFEKWRGLLGKRILSESMESWEMFLNLYHVNVPSSPFKSYFATMYTLSRSLYSILLPKLPKAKIYHALCTGYAGFIVYRAKKELGVPCIITEQGLYTNERRIEIYMAEWIAALGSLDLALEEKKRTLKDIWLNAFFSMSYACYRNCEEIISTFDGNHAVQLSAGADPKKIRTIVHGIHYEDYDLIRESRRKIPKTVAFVGRIVPIKDVKTFIRACSIIHQEMPEIRLYAAGSPAEDPDYFEECLELVDSMNLKGHLQFLGHVNFQEFMKEVDIIVLTSLSEAQPLVILEAGAAGIPAVATNVGGCHQLLYGAEEESPSLGKGGLITLLKDPEATAQAVLKLLQDPDFYTQCSKTIAARIKKYYVFQEEQDAYSCIYNKLLQKTQLRGV